MNRVPLHFEHYWIRARPFLRVATIMLGWFGLLAVLAASAYYGVQVRKWAWEQTVTIRFNGDIVNGYDQGSRVVESASRMALEQQRAHNWQDFFTAYLNTYTDVVAHASNGDYGLDYAPARLLVMSLWVKHLRAADPPVTRWNPAYETTAPLLQFNTVCEAVSAIAMIALLRHWRRASSRWPLLPQWRHPYREWPAVLAGLAVWFNPALIWNAHVWPQWDVWLVPFLLLGLLAASKDWWMLAGFTIMIGAALKGQVLMVLPAILLWPILTGKPLAAVRMVIGAAVLAALMALPWMAHTAAAYAWFIAALIAILTTTTVIGLRKKFDRVGLIVAVVAGLALAPVMVRPDYVAIYTFGAVLIFLTCLLPRWIPRRELWPLTALCLSIAVFLGGLAFGGRFEWFEVGYVYPQHHYFRLVPSGSNLPSILARSNRWQLTDPVVIENLPAMTMRTFLITLFAISLAVCSIGTAVRARQRSPSVLLALAAPWVLMFTIMPQMHERYLLWGAVLMSAGVGISIGQGLLSAGVTFLAWANMAIATLPNDSQLMPLTTRVLREMLPGSAWGLILLALVCTYTAVVPDKALEPVD